MNRQLITTSLKKKIINNWSTYFPEVIEYDKWKDGFFAISGELQISFIDF